MLLDPSTLCFPGLGRAQGILGLLSQWCSLSNFDWDMFLFSGESFKAH